MPRRTFLCVAAAILAALILVAVTSCRRTPSPDPAPVQADSPLWFEDVTDAVGLNFIHDPGPTGTYFMPQSMGSGCAFFDCDGDGLLDIYLLHQGGPKGKKNQLFRQKKGGTFHDVSAGSGLDIAGFNHGVAIGDVNNDGRPDVLVTQYGGLKLLLNKGGGKFEDVTASSGLSNPLWGSSAAFLDYDRDGLLDLVVVNYLDYDPSRPCFSPKGNKDFCGPSQFSGTPVKLFRNLGPGPGKDGKPAAVRFEDVSFQSGIGQKPGPGLGVVCADFNEDGWPDIFVANDGKPNHLWINQKGKSFREEAISRNIAYNVMGQAQAGMGVAVGDVSGSGRLDLFVTHLGTETNTLWKQVSPGIFRDHTVEAGLTTTRWRGTGFGTLLADFDLDGDLDLAIVNGRVFQGGPARDSGLGFWETYAERNQLLANDGAGKFRDVSAANKAFSDHWNIGRGLACADFDGDGSPDLLVSATGMKARLFRNVAPERGHWLAVRATIPKWKRDAYGAEVRVRAGGKEYLRIINPAESYLSSSSPLALFGLGKAGRIESIRVRWPDGTSEAFPGGPVDRLIELRQGEGRKL